jgi:tRNA dimethylallyltransferase
LSLGSSIPYPVLVGPTGVGKSEVAFQLAQEWDAEILSADAFQVYRGFPVGTAQPPLEEQQKIRHHLIACLDLSEKWSSVEFAKKSSAIIHELESRNQRIVVVGGSGFYLKSLVEGSPAGEAPSVELRSWIADQINERGPEKSYQWLAERYPEAAKRIHPNDIYRIGRALEKSYGTPAVRPAPAFRPDQFKFYGLERSRENLDLRLRERIDKMWGRGLLDEARFLRRSGISEDHPVWGAIGYQEADAYLSQKISEADAKEKLFRRTRQYAKRQWTWFKHQHSVQWINLDAGDKISDVAGFILSDLTKG